MFLVGAKVRTLFVWLALSSDMALVTVALRASCRVVVSAEIDLRLDMYSGTL